MSDLGQDVGSLQIKLLEIQHSIDQSRLAHSSIELDEARMKQKSAQYAKSKLEIRAQIAEYEKNQHSISEAINKMMGAAAEQ